MFHGGQPSRIATLLNRVTATMASAGLSPKRLVTLEVAGRRTGRRRSLPVVVAEHEGERYLVAMLGRDAKWVKNVRTAKGRAVLRHGHRESVILEEVEPRERAPILKRYLDVAPGARAHMPVGRNASQEEFERIAERYPVFHVRALSDQQRDS
jgi:deazaflavin-dependent oxidoreductase (nitroreductase family)